MFKNLKRVLNPKSKYISVINMKEAYLQVVADMQNAMGSSLMPDPVRKRSKKTMYVIDFKGDVMATSAHALSQEITAVIAGADTKLDTVLVRVESPGGAVHSYGYAASQIARLKKAGLKTIVAVDRVAASGGYMMACVADKIISAPFAVLGSIGVVAELPNINKMITDWGVEYKQYTAGKYKRTVGTFAPITEEAEVKFKEDLNETYDMFKDHIKSYRPKMNVDDLATGEHWYGSKAYELGLVDEIKTSDELIYEKITDHEVLKVVYMANKPWGERMQGAIIGIFEKLMTKAATMLLHTRYM